MINSRARRNLIAQDSGEHIHDFPQILIGWRGEIECEFSKGSGRLNNGIVGIVPNAAEHLFRGLNNNSELLVIDLVLEDPYIQAMEQACNLSFSETLFKQPDFVSLAPEMLPLLEYSANQLLLGKKTTTPQLNCQLVSLFMTQLSQMYSSEIKSSAINKRIEATRLNDIIDRRLASPPKNTELAGLLHLSESHFYCICQQQFGVSPQKYVMRRRMQRAKFLLLNSKIPLAALAFEVGFSDVSSFSRTYKKYYQQPPGQTRTLFQLGLNTNNASLRR